MDQLISTAFLAHCEIQIRLCGQYQLLSTVTLPSRKGSETRIQNLKGCATANVPWRYKRQRMHTSCTRCIYILTAMNFADFVSGHIIVTLFKSLNEKGGKQKLPYSCIASCC